jgi:hypothetical protein
MRLSERPALRRHEPAGFVPLVRNRRVALAGRTKWGEHILIARGQSPAGWKPQTELQGGTTSCPKVGRPGCVATAGAFVWKRP